MGRYDNEVIYNRAGLNGVVRKAQTIRVIDRTYDKASSNVHIVKSGENLLTIAKLYYGSFENWYLIADKNPLVSDPFDLTIGMELIIPSM